MDFRTYGPFSVNVIAYQSWPQFLELLALIKTLGDQIHSVGMPEAAGIQLQDLLKQPFKSRHLNRKSEHEHNCRANAYWQVRICDLAGCLAKTHLIDGLRFNLNLRDPIADFLPQDAPWRGTAGDYVITLGTSSGAKPEPIRHCLPSPHLSAHLAACGWAFYRLRV